MLNILIRLEEEGGNSMDSKKGIIFTGAVIGILAVILY